MEIIKSHVDQNGRLVIPAKYRKKLNLNSGMEVLLRVDDDELHVCSYKSALSKARDIINQYIPQEVDLVEELSKMRREEAGRE